MDTPAKFVTLYGLRGSIRKVWQGKAPGRPAKAMLPLYTEQPGPTPFPSRVNRSVAAILRSWDMSPRPELVVWPLGFYDGCLVFERPRWAFYEVWHDTDQPLVSDVGPPANFPGTFLGWLDCSDRRARIRSRSRWRPRRDRWAGPIWERFRLSENGVVYRQYITDYRPLPDAAPTFRAFPGTLRFRAGDRSSVVIHTEFGDAN